MASTGTYTKLRELNKSKSPAQAKETAKERATRNSQKSSGRNKTSNKGASKKARKIERKNESLQEYKKERLLAFIAKFLEMKSTDTTSFRYPEDLIDNLDEVQYKTKTLTKKRLGKGAAKKVTKNAILVTALGFVLWDLIENGEKSILYKQLVHHLE